MDVEKIRELQDEIQKIKWLIDDAPPHVKLTEAQDMLTNLKAALSTIDPGAHAAKVGRYFCAQMPCSPSDCGEVSCQYMNDAIANRNNRDPEAIRRECANEVSALWGRKIANGGKHPGLTEIIPTILSAEPAQECRHVNEVTISNEVMAPSRYCPDCKSFLRNDGTVAMKITGNAQRIVQEAKTCNNCERMTEAGCCSDKQCESGEDWYPKPAQDDGKAEVGDLVWHYSALPVVHIWSCRDEELKQLYTGKVIVLMRASEVKKRLQSES